MLENTANKAIRIAGWITRQRQGLLSESELQELNQWLDEDPANRALYHELGNANYLQAAVKQLMKADPEPLVQKVIQKIGNTGITAPRIHFLRRRWFRYAAAATLLLGAATIAIVVSSDRRSQPDRNQSLQKDILPGGDRAVLTLADGSKIVLDSAANGNIAQQGNAAIVKLANGQVAYDLKGPAGGDMMINTIATPKGGQYRLTLPDGSKVWLNAASSIRFPATFSGTIRSVKITGEVYFEVVKNEEKPFMVDVDGKASVRVLGTSFNINSYENEGAIKTTLADGSVSVSNGNQKAILRPGQQAAIASSPSGAGTSPHRQIEITNADMEQTLAWKNGIFNFNGLGVHAVMAQLERWYDIDVRYEGAVPSNIFRGEMYRNAKLSFVLDGLREMGIKCSMEGRTVVVTQ